MCTYCIRSSFWSQIWLEMAQRKDPQSNTRLSRFSQQCWVLQISQLGANPSFMTKKHVLVWSYAHTDGHPFLGFSFKPHDKEMKFKSIKLHKIFFGSALWLSFVEYSLACKHVDGNWVDWVHNQCKNPLVHTDLHCYIFTTFTTFGTCLGHLVGTPTQAVCIHSLGWELRLLSGTPADYIHPLDSSWLGTPADTCCCCDSQALVVASPCGLSVVSWPAILSSLAAWASTSKSHRKARGNIRYTACTFVCDKFVLVPPALFQPQPTCTQSLSNFPCVWI